MDKDIRQLVNDLARNAAVQTMFVQELRALYAGLSWQELEPRAACAWPTFEKLTDLHWYEVREAIRECWMDCRSGG